MDIVRAPYKRTRVIASQGEDLEQHIVTPGDVITQNLDFMKSHGTALSHDHICATVAGAVYKVDKLVSVKGVNVRYRGEIGDVVVGRITEVQQKKWKVDAGSRLDCQLQLSSVYLPGNQLRRKNLNDELMMREYFTEGDLICGEVSDVGNVDGMLKLHMRSNKYGKLPEGVLIKVPSVLIKRSKLHFHRLPCNATVILGNNGYIWVGPHFSPDQPIEPFTQTSRETIARLSNVIKALAAYGVQLFDTIILTAYDISMKYKVKELLNAEVMEHVAQESYEHSLHQNL